jgi:sulfite reductase (ferredoxin)
LALVTTATAWAMPKLLLASAVLAGASAYQLVAPVGRASRVASAPRMQETATDFGLAPGQKYGPTAPAHQVSKPWSNLETQEGVQIIKAASNDLRQPLLADMGARRPASPTHRGSRT